MESEIHKLQKFDFSQKPKKILFVVPPNITFEAFKYPGINSKTWTHSDGTSYGVLITDVPLGVLALSAWVKGKHDSDSRILDFNVEMHKSWSDPNASNFYEWFKVSIQKVVDLDFTPDIIAISSLFVSGYENLISIAKVSRELFRESIIVAGGQVPTSMYKELLLDAPGYFDALCAGEGEIPFSELLQSQDMKIYLEESDFWVTDLKHRSNPTKVYKQSFVQNLDEIPFLDYESINLSDYHQNPTAKAYTSIRDKTNYITYMGSRGCKFHCTFCAQHTVHGRTMRAHSLERIREELTALKSKFNPSTLVIEDDMFLWNKEWAKGVLNIAQDLDLICFFPNALALYQLDWDMLNNLRNSGVTQLTLAVESGSARVLKELMRKPLNLSITNRVALDCRKLGIYTDCNIIIGMPGETEKDIEDTRNFLRSLNANWYRINVATPLVGSDMYKIANQKGYIKGDIRKSGYKRSVIETPDFNSHQIESVAYDINLEMNFINNTDMRFGNYESAMEAFENVLTVRKDHTLAFYYLTICKIILDHSYSPNLDQLKLDSDLRESEFWNSYFSKHNLERNFLSAAQSATSKIRNQETGIEATEFGLSTYTHTQF